jgi:hypothetical protein
LTAGSTYTAEVNGILSDKLAVTGALTLKGTLSMVNKGAAYKIGDSFTVWSAGTITGAFDNVLPEKPASGLVWDLSDLSTIGVIRVAADPTDVRHLEEASVRIGPNPARQQVTVEMPVAPVSAIVELLSARGDLLQRVDASGRKSLTLSVAELPNALYILRIQLPESVISRKILKE